tara:strand:- start:1129 stop:1965 length:837 start_codon:yes stop_codon:yes gene_type:complete
MINFKEYDDRTDQYVADEIKKRRLAKQVVNATDDYKMKKTKPAFTFPHHTGSTTIHVYLRKMSSGVVAYNYDLKFDEGSHQRKVAQDDDVEDREGTQPAKYYKGVKSKSTKQARARHFEKGAKMDDDNPAAYKPAPGDKSAKTKPSKHTLKYKKMFGENKSDKAMMMKLTTKAMKAIPNSPDQKELIKQVNVYRKKLGMKPMKEENLNEKIKGLVKKAEKSGISYGILKKVYDRGMAAWRTGHRPGTTPQQWAFARVNSFITGGGARKADADLWKKRK